MGKGSVRPICVAIVLAVSAFVLPTESVAAPRWAPAATAPIHPGVQTRSAAGQCTANFVFYNSTDVFIGQAAHCTTAEEFLSSTNPCRARMLPLGTAVTIQGARKKGTLVYNSWQTMQRVRERSDAACLGNDFALVRLDRADRGRVNPSIPVWGGPRGIDKRHAIGDRVYSYGNSSLRQGLEPLSPKAGVYVGDSNSGWTRHVYTASPGIFGDSGSAVIGPSGGAMGVLVTIEYLPPASNGVLDLPRALNYMYAKTSHDSIKLANGTAAFVPPA